MSLYSTASTQNPRIYTVSSLNAQVRLLLENEMGVVWLIGELSNFSAPVSGHWYFTLKDARAQVKCAMFRGNNQRVTFRPANGNQVLVKARLSLYEPRGDYQLIIDSMQPEGDGRLQQQFEKLKMQLAAEGLFAQTLKKPLPEQPKRVGIITSKTGAALHDILQVLKRRDPSLPVVIYPTMVQGEGAAISIAQAIGRANTRQECDVLIVGRGGGSLEDLWAFNEEIVARTIAASQIPIISAVGHEVDVTIADFVADMRAPTPSAAAELVSRDLSARVQKIHQHQQQLRHAMRHYLSVRQSQLVRWQHRLDRQHPQVQLNQQSQRLDELRSRLERAMRKQLSERQQHLHRSDYKLALHSPAHQLERFSSQLATHQRRLRDAMDRRLVKANHQLALATEKLDAVSPLATLARGYSITRDKNGQVIRSSSQVNAGDTLQTTLADGNVHSIVTE
ncbi:exodeoxyribonuclease VII large subunit [Photobacterium halotolerans]|uniref:Exodeoxyribonuclease 7 large subunit n=1 Tax=Photobacterium halotolerans TaxID=265726 RepID=A0A0F5VHH7_9GAMM|nr:exodeoxyribonuclease VII large subunit [Photobacterium halotolerans]KKD01528.1 exodeoxyribonuclease VII large subunit [Photobacterium halotolerans]